MTELLFCPKPQSQHVLRQSLGIKSEPIVDRYGNTPSRFTAHKPYAITPKLTSEDIAILNRLSSMEASRKITNLANTLGPENTVAAADVTAKLFDYNVGLVGASTAVYGYRVKDFGTAVQNYQAALLKYRDVMRSNGADKAAAKLKAQQAYNLMQSKFQHELNTVNSLSRARKGTPLSSNSRALNIARSSRTATKLHVTNTIQASNLIKFGKYTNTLGNGLVLLDVGSRVGNIHNAYKADGNWEKELFVESLSFGLSATTGIITAKAGVAALGFLMVATPVGWVGLIVAGATVAATTTGASIWVNNATKDNGGSWYDGIMNWINN